MGMLPRLVVADHVLKNLSAVCILETQESREQFRNFNNSSVSVGTTPGSTTESALHSSL